MQVSTFSVITSKLITYLESYVDFGLTSSYKMMFKHLNVSFSPKCLAVVRWSRQFRRLASASRFIPHTYCTWRTHAFSD